MDIGYPDGYMGGFHRFLWAKSDPYKQVIAHMVDAGCCARTYISSPASSALLSFFTEQWKTTKEDTVSFISYLVAMHDIGKATPQFQMQNEEQIERLNRTEIRAILPEAKLKPERHEFLSGRAAARIWKSQGETRRIYDAYASVLTLHHQRLDRSEKRKQTVHEGWQIIQDELESTIRRIFGFSGHLPVPESMDPVCVLLTGIVILCDWVASSGPFDGLPEYAEGYYEESLKIAGQALKTYGLTENHHFSGIESFKKMWPAIMSPRDVQIKCEALDPYAPLTIIEAPMGEGKTEAALFVAAREAQSWGKRGIYVALPTQATSNQMYGRFVSMLETVNGGYARLLHGTAFLMKDELKSIQSVDAPEAEKWFGSARMGLLDENGVGTVDQAMGGVLLVRFSVLRLLGLSNKTLIIDELHAYDAYMSEIIESLLKWCRSLHIPVVLLSATLQNSQRKRYISSYLDHDSFPELSDSYPLITQVTEEGTVTQTPAEATMTTEYLFEGQPLGQDQHEIAHFAVEWIRNGGCYCILANTVKMAQGIFRELMEVRDPDTEIMLFHARFPMGKRMEIEKQCIDRFGKAPDSVRPKKAILVATQVVEQSLDIDFDGMISELAPVDLLLQRAGRVHRHRNRVRPPELSKPVIHVILPGLDAADDLENRYGSTGYVYAPFLLYNSEKLLEEGKTICVPKDVRSIIAQVYENVSEENMQAWQERAFNQQLMAANADRVAFPPPAQDYFFPAQAHPEFENMNIDDGFDPSARAATRLGEPTFRISFVSHDLVEKAKKGYLSKEEQKEILLSSVSLRMTPEIRAALSSGDICQILRGPLRGCYLTDQCNIIRIGNKKLINDSLLGVYWEE